METNAAGSNTPVLRAENISRLSSLNKTPKKIISQFSFTFQNDRIYNILGPSGAGKSSLLRLFNRLDEITDGRLFYKDRELREYSPCGLRREIGYLFQTPYLFPTTVKDNFSYIDSSLTEGEINSLLAEVNLDSEYLTSNVEVLSVGEKQRIALARLLAMKPRVMLLDEPTSALDERNSSIIVKLIKRKISENEITAIIVTHNPRQALDFGGEALLLMEGKLVENGPARDLISAPQTEAGKRFLEGDSE
jgi:putative ABC transport system ATP-binding protein